MTNLKQGPLDLQREVLQTGQCSACGMCLGMCPYIMEVDERVAVVHSCGLDDGNCYRVCPQTSDGGSWAAGSGASERREGTHEHALGPYTEIFFARAVDEKVARRGQYGGTVSALMIQALEHGEIDAGVLTGTTPAGQPRPAVARSREEVLACAGSKFTAAPTLKAVHAAARDGLQRLGVVGRPCQVTALRKLQAQGRATPRGAPPAADRIALVIGLFCFWALTADFYRFLEQRVGLSRILKVDIPKDGLEVTTEDGGVQRWPVDLVRPYIRPSCLRCGDPTAELADLSVGSTEYDPGWNTLIVRTTRGQALVDRAVKGGWLELRPYPLERLEILRSAVLGKRQRIEQARQEQRVREGVGV